MKFLHPEFLWAFAVLIVPIIIHLFNFKRYKTLYFSSLSFVKHVDQQTKSTQKLRHILILISRLLAFTFLVLAFAQPYFSTQEEDVKSKNPIIAFYIDNSFSMEARGVEGELLSEARENARQVIEKAPMDARFLIGTNEMSGSEERLLNKIESFEKLDKISHTPIIRSLDDVLRWQFERFKKEDLSSEAKSSQYILFSDFQKANGYSKLQQDESDISFYPIKLSPESTANIYIDSVWYSAPIHKLNFKNELNIRIVNSGDQSLENVEVVIDIDQYKKTIFIDLPASESTTTQVGYMDKTTGIKTGKVHVMDDHVFFDDTYYLSYEVKKNVNILILDGKDAVSNFATVFDLDNYFNYIQKEITSITKDDFDEKDLVILNGINEISRGVSNYLVDFSKTGGSLGLFPGKEPKSSDWNALLNQLRLPTLGNKIASGNKISTLNYDDPFFDGVFENQTTKLNLPSVSAVYRAQENTNAMASSLVKLQNGLPLISVSRSQGTSLMFYSSLHPDYGSFARDALFSTIALRLGEISQRSQPDFIVIGKETRYPIYKKINTDNPIHIVNEEFDFIPQASSVSGVNYISLNNLSNIQELRAGNYEIKTDRVIGMISLNYDRKESNLTSFSENEIMDQLKAGGAKEIVFNEIGKGSQLSTIDIDKPFSYWKIFIVLTFIFVLMEMLLVRFLK